MKPTDKFIKWLQAHPAVGEALQEQWEPQAGDWVMWGQCLGLVTFVPSGPFVPPAATTYLRVKFSDERTTSKKSDDLSWLPTLGQLVRMLQKEWSDWEDRLEIWIHKETGGNKGTKAVLRPKVPHYSPIIESSKWEWESEIACLALWAKVKGVECD